MHLSTILVAAVRAYRVLLSPWLGSSCRFMPTCSAFALEALETHGAVRGSYLTLRRLARCHPWCEGGCDPVPSDKSQHLPGRAASKPQSSAVTLQLPARNPQP